MKRLQYREKTLELSSPVVMGILNATPDSFYTGRGHFSENELLQQAEKMLIEGASILDLGGMSSRPGSKELSTAEELGRVLPVFRQIRKQFPNTWISVDTYRSDVAAPLLEEGADLINDISGGILDPSLCELAVQYQVPYICMHMPGKPLDMQQHAQYEDVVSEVLKVLSERIRELKSMGITQVISDPGFGFGKNVNHNYQLLSSLERFQELDCPLLVGISRKSMISRVLNIQAEQALNGTTALHMVALQKGAGILRVHDVLEAMQCIQLYRMLNPGA